MSKYNVIVGKNKPIKMWTKGVPIEEDAIIQLSLLSELPFIHKHIAVMPDCHVGVGATIGTVLATNGAIVPSAVGVDIGCGMNAVKTTLTANDLPDNLHTLRTKIESKIPHGRTHNGDSKNDVGSWGSKEDMPNIVKASWDNLRYSYAKIIYKHPKANSHNTFEHLGTLGTGNHFIEICLDENDDVWVMLHSGSRGLGNKIGQYFIEAAKKEMEKYYITEFLPHKDLAYLVEHTELYDDYIYSVNFAQQFAHENRRIMMEIVLQELYDAVNVKRPEAHEMIISCHHNYVEKENHFGKNVLVTRKGAVRARVEDYGIIPGSMGAGSFIVKGKGDKDSFCSCSHGAGRKMSRGKAKEIISLDDHAKAMKGIEARLDADVLDESPAAYKNINDVMLAQDSLVDIVFRLRQILNVKG